MIEQQIVLTRTGELLPLLTQRSIRRMLVFHGRSSYTLSGGKDFIESLPVSVQVHTIGEIPENPEYSRIAGVVGEYQAFHPDAILAIGGGSVIDTAKAVIAAAGGSTPEELFSGRFVLPQPKPFMIAMPTTSGSGAEATHFAVVYHEGIKHSLASPGLRPDAVVLDPGLTFTCPQSVTLASGADAVCQAIESYWSRAATAESRQLSLQALPLLLGSLMTAARAPQNLSARRDMQNGANLAGKAIDITKTTAGHALSYSLTAMLGIPHGLAVLLVMQQLVPVMINDFGWSDSKLQQVFSHSMNQTDFANAFQQFCNDIFSVPALQRITSPERVHSTNETDLARKVNVERLRNHPIQLQVDTISGIYADCLAKL